MPTKNKSRRRGKTPTIPETDENTEADQSSDSSTTPVASSSGIRHSQVQKSPTPTKQSPTTLSVNASPFTPSSSITVEDESFNALSRALDEELTKSQTEAAARALEAEIDNIPNDDVLETTSAVPEKPSVAIPQRSLGKSPKREIPAAVLQKVLTGIPQPNSQTSTDPDGYRNGQLEKFVELKSQHNSKKESAKSQTSHAESKISTNISGSQNETVIVKKVVDQLSGFLEKFQNDVTNQLHESQQEFRNQMEFENRVRSESFFESQIRSESILSAMEDRVSRSQNRILNQTRNQGPRNPQNISHLAQDPTFRNESGWDTTIKLNNNSQGVERLPLNLNLGDNQRIPLFQQNSQRNNPFQNGYVPRNADVEVASQASGATSAADLDRGISALSENPRMRELRRTADIRRQSNKSGPKNDSANLAAKEWMNYKLDSSGSTLYMWRMLGQRYFRSVGLKCMDFMNPFKVPTTIQDWIQLDNRCYNSEWYNYYVEQRESYGNIEDDHFALEGNEDLIKVNSYYLAVVNTSFNGFNTMVNTTIESSICQITMNSVFPSVTQRGNAVAGRYIYYNAYRKFMLISDKAKLARLNYITNELDTVAGETIKDFAKRLKVESDTMNMMEGNIAITETQLKTILMKVVEKNFQNVKYWTAFHTLTESNPNYTFDDLVEAYDKVWVQEQGFVVNSEGSLYNVMSNTNGSFVPSHQSPKSHSVFSAAGPAIPYPSRNRTESVNFSGQDKRSKKELKKDASGRLICFGFARDKTCKFGEKCKYSHKPEAAEKVLSAFTLKEINNTANEQIFQIGYNRGKKKERSLSKSRNKNWRKNFKSNFRRKFPQKFKRYQQKHNAYFSTSNSDSKNNSKTHKNSNTFQSAIADYRDYTESKQSRSANVVESVEDQELNAVFFSDSGDSSDICYSSDDSDYSDSSSIAASSISEIVNLAQVIPTSETVNLVQIIPTSDTVNSTQTIPMTLTLNAQMTHSPDTDMFSCPREDYEKMCVAVKILKENYDKLEASNNQLRAESVQLRAQPDPFGSSTKYQFTAKPDHIKAESTDFPTLYFNTGSDYEKSESEYSGSDY